MGNLIPSVSSSTSLTLTLLSHKGHAHDALDRAEEIDHYLEECNEDRSNRMARQDTAYAAQRITYYELKRAEVALENSISFLPPRLLSDLTTVSIVPLMPSADGGMPHTRPGNLLCCPDLSQIAHLPTLIHELWHIHQRLYMDVWTRVFHEWGWTPLEDTSAYVLSPRIEAVRRYNPDTIDSPFWVYQHTWIPIPVFKDPAHPSVSDTEIWFIHRTEGYHVRTVPPEMRQSYPTAPDAAFEHPREMAAYLLSNPDRHRGTPGFEALRSFVGETAMPPSALQALAH